MRYIVFDMEWNQPVVRKKRVNGLLGEIIQIGALALDEEMNELDTFDVTIKPVFYKIMNRDVSELTQIKQDDIEEGVSFAEAIDAFRKWCGDDYCYISWSFSDMDMLINNLEKHDMDTDWLPECYDAQLMFDDQFTQEDRDYALSYALYYFNEKPDSAHDALDDARSTVKVLRHMDMEEGLIEEFTYRYELEMAEYDE